MMMAMVLYRESNFQKKDLRFYRGGVHYVSVVVIIGHLFLQVGERERENISSDRRHCRCDEEDYKREKKVGNPATLSARQGAFVRL